MLKGLCSVVLGFGRDFGGSRTGFKRPKPKPSSVGQHLLSTQINFNPTAVTPRVQRTQ